jgi:AraC-like DNA-binding protein/quercetin dioxygenase-like cupin family protein
MVRRLIWEEVSEGRDFHAALVSLSGRRRTELHTHDFAEVMYVLAGRGAHPVNETFQTIREGDLLLIRPEDRHGVSALPGESLIFTNIAFPTDRWADFHQASGIGPVAQDWSQRPLPPAIVVPPTRREQAAGVFERILRAYHEQPTRLELIGFWVEATRLMLDDSPQREPEDAGPQWLVHACRAMRDERNLREGLPRLLALADVSAGHLSRAMQRYRNQTPTDFLVELRLERAATLLATTPREIIAISGDCGFGSLSYFYRLFHKRYGATPAQYRSRFHRSVAP